MKEILWIISELFPPEETSTAYIMGEIANALTSKYEVKVICGPEVYDSSKKVNHNFPIEKSIQIFRVKGLKENKKNTFSRIKKYISISWQIYSIAKKKIEPNDRVLMVSNPFPLIVLMALLRKHRSFKLNMLVHDVFPETLYTDISLPSPILSLLSSIFNKSYSHTDNLIVIGRDMKEIMKKKTKGKTNISIIENWADTNIRPKSDTNITSNNVIIQYAGNIGHAQGVSNFIDFIHTANNHNLKVEIWGSGSATDEIKKKITDYKLENIVSIHGPYMRSLQSEVLDRCDLALVTLVKGMYGLGVPSKSYNILASGTPILYIGERNSEIWLMVQENSIGFCFEPSDKMAIIEFLKSLSPKQLHGMGRTARKLAEQKYSKEIILDKFKEII